jgi:hypothetical protein
MAPNSNDRAAVQLTGPTKLNFMTRYWRGEIALPVSYWLVGIAIYVVIATVSYVFGDIMPTLDLSPVQIGFALIAFVVFLATCTTWQAVGLWRSASRYKRTSSSPGWGTAAQMMLLIGVTQSVVVFAKILLPLVVASGNIIVGNNNIPAYQMRLMNGGAELELSGGIPYGTASALKTILDASPSVKIVHLNSIGGIVEEGSKVAAIIRAKGLATYTATSCMSACTVAFLGGQPRFLGNDARLGFHSASYGGLDAKDMPELNGGMHDALATMNVPKWFIDKTLATSAKDMWFPTQQQLLDAGIITKVVDRADYAFSGVDWRKPDAIDKALLETPLYVALKDKDPQSYALIRDRFAEGIRRGSTSLAMLSEVRSVFQGQVLPKYLKAAPDVALVNYWNVQVEEIRYMRVTNPQVCLQYLFPAAQSAPVDLGKFLGADLLGRIGGPRHC